MMKRVIAGIDESESSLRAVDWAAEESQRRGWPLYIVHAVAPWLFETPVDPRVRALREWLLTGGRDIVDRAVAYARETAPGIDVEGEEVPGPAAAALLDKAKAGAMVVVAGHGAGGAVGLLLGSVALQVAAHATVPAVVVRHWEPAVHREVVVGVDGSDRCQEAIAFACEEALLRRARLRVVHAWMHPASTGPGDVRPLVYDAETIAEEEERLLAESMAGWQEKFPDVEIIQDVARGRPVRILAGASARADLLVVGTRGRGGFVGLMLGSVSNAMLHRAHCPVAVVPGVH